MKVVNRIGKIGEDMAVALLMNKGYRILDRNFHCRYGEIDIIALTQRTVVFIEVKTRTSTTFGSPVESITRHKLKAIASTAYVYRESHPDLPKNMQIDAIVIQLDREGSLKTIEHLQSIGF